MHHVALHRALIGASGVVGGSREDLAPRMFRRGTLSGWPRAIRSSKPGPLWWPVTRRARFGRRSCGRGPRSGRTRRSS